MWIKAQESKSTIVAAVAALTMALPIITASGTGARLQASETDYTRLACSMRSRCSPPVHPHWLNGFVGQVLRAPKIQPIELDLQDAHCQRRAVLRAQIASPSCLQTDLIRLPRSASTQAHFIPPPLSKRRLCSNSKPIIIRSRCNFIARVAIVTNTTDVGQEDLRFAGNIGAHIPGRGARVERRIGDFVAVLDPAILGSHASASMTASSELVCICAMQSAIQSTCCSMETIMLESTDGLCGPVIMNKLGNPADIMPR